MWLQKVRFTVSGALGLLSSNRPWCLFDFDLLFGTFVIHPSVDARKDGILRILLDAGSNVNQVDSDGKAPLHLATEYGKVDGFQ